MPTKIEHIDAIARKRDRDVLHPEFHFQSFQEWRNYRYDNDPMRAAVLAWLDAHEISWIECGPFADPCVMAPYLGAGLYGCGIR